MRDRARVLRPAACAAALLAALGWAHAIEVAPLTEREALQLAQGSPPSPSAAHAGFAASQPQARPAGASAEDAVPHERAHLLDGHPLSLVLAGLALLWWGVQRTRRR